MQRYQKRHLEYSDAMLQLKERQLSSLQTHAKKTKEQTTSHKTALAMYTADTLWDMKEGHDAEKLRIVGQQQEWK